METRTDILPPVHPQCRVFNGAGMRRYIRLLARLGHGDSLLQLMPAFRVCKPNQITWHEN